MNKLFLLGAFLFAGISSISAATINVGNWNLDISDSNGQTSINYAGKALIPGNTCKFKNSAGEEVDITTSFAFNGITTADDYSDEFGKGKKVDLKYKDSKSTLKAIHTYYIYNSLNYILSELSIMDDNNAVVESNFMAPINSNSYSTALPAVSGTNAFLVVPFDNDAWIRYTSNVFRNNKYTSYEVGCFYNTQTNEGIVVGSIEHDNWKTGVTVSVRTPNIISNLSVFGGISDNFAGAIPTTRDRLPHGKVKGTIVKSPKILIGYFNDWKKGMETYGHANAVQNGKLKWDKGTPFGWNSWGNAQTSLSYNIANEASRFFAEELAPEFSNDGTTYIGLDSYWTNLTLANRRKFVVNCKSRGQKAGIYWTPWVDWGGNPAKIVEGSDGKYTYNDIYLRINGNIADFPHESKGYALDPTHPGTKMRIDYYMNEWVRDGYEFIKLDFMTHGTFEADSWADTEITTGIQAYNQGMKYIADKIGDKMYVNLSIAPLFPSQYAHGRRITCDTYGSMDQSKYALNALTHSWWTDQFYSYNDPDYMVFGGFNGSGTYPDGKTYDIYTQGENRARYTTVVTTGLCLLGDDFLNSSNEARERAKVMVTKKEVNKLAKIGKSFYPVKSDIWNNQQSDLYMYSVADTVYVAAYNFDKTPAVKTVNMQVSELGLDGNKTYLIHELWSDKIAKTDVKDNITFDIPAFDVCIFKIYPEVGGSVSSVLENKIKLYPNPCNDILFLDGLAEYSNLQIDVFSICGTKVMGLDAFEGSKINVSDLDRGSYILKATDSNQNLIFTNKFLKI